MKKTIIMTFAVLMLLSCKSTDKTTSNPTLNNVGPDTVWVLKSIKNKLMAFNEFERLVTISFNPEAGQVSGCAGCNRYSAAYREPKSGKLEFDPIIATKMACPQPMMETERMYISALNKINGYVIANDTLKLLQDENILLTFEKQTEDTK